MVPGHCVPQACPNPAEYLAGQLEQTDQVFAGSETNFVCNPGYVMAADKSTRVAVECKIASGGILVKKLFIYH